MARVEAPHLPHLPHPDFSRLGDVAREGIRWVGRDYHWAKTSLAVLVGGGGAAATIGRETIEQLLSRPAIPRTLTVSPPEDKTVFIGNQEEGVKVAPVTPTAESSPTPDIPKPKIEVNLTPKGPVTVDNPKGLEIAKNISVSLPFRINARLCAEGPAEGEVSFLSSNGNRFLLQIDSKDQCQLRIEFKDQKQSTWRVKIGPVGDAIAIEFAEDGKTVSVYENGKLRPGYIPPSPIELFRDRIDAIQASVKDGSKFTISALSIEGENVTYIPATPTPDIPPTATATETPAEPTAEPTQPKPKDPPPPQPTPRPAPPPTVEATKIPTPEVITKPFPDIGNLAQDGFIVHNNGKNFGFVVSDYYGSQSGLTAQNLQYVKDMFSKYRNDPNGGKGRTLEIFIYDNPDVDPFILQSVTANPLAPEGTRYFRFARLNGNNIQVYLALQKGFDWRSGAAWISIGVNTRSIMDFLSGYHDTVLSGASIPSGTPGYAPDIAALNSPIRLVPTTLEQQKYLEYLKSIGVIK